MKKEKPQQVETEVKITPPNIQTVEFNLIGTSPFVQLRFSKKQELLAEMGKPKEPGKKKVRSVRDYDAEFEAAQHKSTEGWVGIPAGAFRAGLIRACSIVNFKMTLAKLSIFVLADGVDADDGTPLVRIYGKPEKCQHHCRNANGSVDIRTRAMWREWTAKLRIQYDADQFSMDDVTNLLARMGIQVGIGEGRPASKESAGMGWGTFRLE